MKRYALASLVEAAGMSEAELGRRVGLSGSSLTKARRDGLIESAADRYACRAGLVPWLVWSDWLEDVFVECPECGERFVAKRRDQRYCTQKCGHRRRARERVRARYQSDPEWREARKAEVRAYREENARAIRIQQAAWRDQNRERRAAQQRAYYAANRERILARQAEYDRRKREQVA